MKIGEKISVARQLFERWSEALREDGSIRRGLGELRASLDRSAAASVRVGIWEVCRRCDEEEGGSCCGAGIENRYTPEMLLVNLLMGAELPEARLSEKSCYFLGGSGCLLPARDIICINYLCARVRKEIPEDDLLFLQETTGREMEAVFLLHDRIRKRIRQQ